MLRGLPGSGKSTYARELVAKGGWTRVNNDDIRDSFHGGKWSKNNEQLIDAIRKAIIYEALERGFNVVVDNLNLHPKHELGLNAIANLLINRGTPVNFEQKFFDVPVEECIKRDLKRNRSVGKDVIMGWYNDYLKPKPEVYIPPVGKPDVVLCDIDGTLAHMNGKRGPFDWSKVGGDDLDPIVADIISMYYLMDANKVVLVSGRDEVCRSETEVWLDKYDIPYEGLFMRPKDDKRRDTIVKREIFDNHIRENYNVQFVLDDRDAVVAMWRSLGLKCLQVAEGAF
jgi:predicted kinase